MVLIVWGGGSPVVRVEVGGGVRLRDGGRERGSVGRRVTESPVSSGERGQLSPVSGKRTF